MNETYYWNGISVTNGDKFKTLNGRIGTVYANHKFTVEFKGCVDLIFLNQSGNVFTNDLPYGIYRIDKLEKL